MTHDEEREAITAAMHRLLAGKPLRSSGELTIVALAAEAGLKRNKLTHKHVDLKDLFNAERRARLGIPDSELKLHEQIDRLKAKVAALRTERDDYRTASETFARAIHVLTVENDNLRKEIRKHEAPKVTCLPSR
ncbi:hypothetical protein BZB76_5146 [Actinomadura pelletieri DSM 43383]|uniref:Uncharacterized protein n=1 Tax=Actinomadura pelletieri DSM 43383 TaxID=1120940 RepID=A0A495QFZ8_9ACTN|nr:hypothetical protein [Actinomadura pelletieri]RKS70671.1 hypothetical protein BZB76_5146 [Actinomadura pelletieri DSM 43383]